MFTDLGIPAVGISKNGPGIQIGSAAVGRVTLIGIRIKPRGIGGTLGAKTSVLIRTTGAVLQVNLGVGAARRSIIS